MARVLSALVLLPLVIGTVWYLPPVATLVLAAVAALIAFFEYAAIVQALDAAVPRSIAAIAVVAACVAVGGSYLAIDVVLMSAVIAFGALAVASGQPGPRVLHDSAASVLPIAYIGLPLGAIAAVRALAGREAVLLLMLTIVISDSAQYYTGRAFGRRPLAPTISPKKTVEGAFGGLIFGTLAMAMGGRYVFPEANLFLLVLVSASIAALGIVGDLFESLLKRSAGVKDSSHIIPGHGGVLDRIDSWLFAAPLYYVFVRFLQF
ncbi:MAG: phosphatidate cytidylyltransferase [Vicinamibacterales bacterium]